MEYVLDQREIRLGRGPGVDLALEEPSLACQHARIVFGAGAFHLVAITEDVATEVNGGPIDRQELKPSDRLRLGDVLFEFAVEARMDRDSAR